MTHRIPNGLTKKTPIRPLQYPEELDLVRQVLLDKPRDLLLFNLAVQTGLKLDDLLHLKAKDLIYLRAGDRILAGNGKARADETPVMSREIAGCLRSHLSRAGLTADDFLFPSRKGGQPLTLSSASHLIQKWFRTAGLTGLTGARSLRRTWEHHFKAAQSMEHRSTKDKDSMHVLKPARTATLQEIVYKELFGAIVAGLILPGERLVTEKIAKQMNVSPSPVREALRRLEAAGFVSAPTPKGSVVNALSQENLEEVIKIRLVLESMAVESAALKRSDEMVGRLEYLERQYEQLMGTDNVDEIIRVNREIHHLIYTEAHMPILKQVIDGLWDRVSPYLHLYLRLQGRRDWKETTVAHRGMVDGIRKRNPAQASKWLRADLTSSAKRADDMLTHLKDQ